MARIAFGWELGQSYGHAISCAGLARALANRGHTIAFMFRELRQIHVLPESTGYDVFQVPTVEVEGASERIPVSAAEIMLGCGYRDPAQLVGLLGGWRTLLSRWRADLVIGDFAPTGLLAARTLGMRRISFGNGFFLPPRVSPLPAFRFDEVVDPRRVAQADATALATTNAALARLGARPLERLADIFEVDDEFLCTFPELDHYGDRPTSGYWGPRLRLDMGSEVAWPRGSTPRVFVYVHRTLPQLDALISSLAAGGYRVLAYVADLDPARRARLSGPGRTLLERPVRLESVLKECDLLACMGGEIAGGALARGVPVLMFPQHYEQYATGRRAEQLGAGAWMNTTAQRADIDAALRALTTQPRFKAAAQAFARRYPGYSPTEQRRRFVQRVEVILAR